MAGSIYKSFRVRWSEAWYGLSEAERENLLEKVGEVLTKSGGKTVIMCRTDWANEQWQAFGVEEFPDLEAVQKHHDLLNALEWFRYIDSESQLGTAWE